MSTLIITPNSYNYIKIGFVPNNNYLFFEIRENLRSVVPEDLNRVIIQKDNGEITLDVKFNIFNLRHYIENNEYFCRIELDITEEGFSFETLKYDRVDIRSLEVNSIPDIFFRPWSTDENIEVYSSRPKFYNQDIKVVHMNGDEVIFRPIEKPEPSNYEIELTFEITDENPSYDCNNIPNDIEGPMDNYEVIFIVAKRDFEVLNIPEGWELILFRRPVGIYVANTNKVHKNCFWYDLGITTEENRTLKKLIRKV